jgi:L-threonylcarbamoyladenylate synthase
MQSFAKDIENCLAVLTSGGLILYPTDTIWGIGCDATNELAVNKIFELKHRAESKAMIILLSDEKEITRYVKGPDPEIVNYISIASQPTTAIFEKGMNIACELLSYHGTIAIRIVKDKFCANLINEFGKPIVSTSANIAGQPAPANFIEINKKIKNGVDYIVQHRQDDFKAAKPSAIIKMNDERQIIIVRS